MKNSQKHRSKYCSRKCQGKTLRCKKGLQGKRDGVIVKEKGGNDG